MASKPVDPKDLQAVVDALARCGGNQEHAARALNMPRSTLISRLGTARRLGFVSSLKPSSETPDIDTSARQAYLASLPKKEIRRYVITSAQNATPVHTAFFASLLHYCRRTKAELIVIPIRYKNPTSMWTAQNEEAEWWDKATLPYLLNRRTVLSKNLVILADISVQPTAIRPLSGFDTITGGASAILGHPKLELATVATPQHKLPKIITTTGSCTVKNYTNTKAGKKGDFHHTFGACVVDVHGDEFHMRQINAVKNGSFIDLDWEYTRTGYAPAARCEALIMGDTHQEFVDPAVVAATFGKGGIIATLKPKYVVWHDLHDFYSRNHHHRQAVFTNFAKHHSGAHNVEKALDAAFAFVDDHAHAGVNVFVPSNHPDALNKWVQETDPREDPENAIFWAETFVVCCKGAKMTDTGVKTLDPFTYWAKKKLATAARSLFLKRDESFVLKGVELGYHGDRGPNGSRGSIGGFTKIGVKTVIGHSHSPGIRDGVYQVGLNSRYGLEYRSGPSSWLQTDCLLYANGKRTLVNFIGGNWRAK